MNRAGEKFLLQNRQKTIRMQFFLIEIEIEMFINQIRAPGGHIQVTIMIDAQQQYIKRNIHGEISIIMKNKFFMTSEINHKCPPVRKT